MAEHRKVPFVTVSACTTAARSPPSEPGGRRPEAGSEPSRSRCPESGSGALAAGSGRTVRLKLSLFESGDLCSPEFSYTELVQVQRNPAAALDPTHHQEREKRDARALAWTLESKRCEDLVPAPLATQPGRFYINTGSQQVPNPSESNSRDTRRGRDDESEPERKRRRDDAQGEEIKTWRNQPVKPSVSVPERKRRRKLKDSLCLAAMLGRLGGGRSNPSIADSNHSKALLAELTSDPAMMSLLTSANESELQELLSDFEMGGENGATGLNRGLAPPSAPPSAPPLPEGLTAPLLKRIEDLRTASRQFEEEGRKKFFTLDMNNILLDIELQVQDLSVSARAAVYSHLEAFVPCNKETLIKRLKKLSFSIQDDRLRAPLLKLKLAVCSVMPEQITRYNIDCMARVAAKQQMESGERNGSEEEEEDEEEKAGRRVVGPRKKFLWDDELRALLCNLVRVKLQCYEQEPSSVSLHDYLRSFMETDVKPLWPKGWMQTRMLFKESHSVHGLFTDLGRRRIISIPRAPKLKEMGWTQDMQLSSAPSSVRLPPTPPSELVCLSDSLEDDLDPDLFDSVSQTRSHLRDPADGASPTPAPSPSCSTPLAPKPLPHTPSPTPSPSTSSSVAKDGPGQTPPANRPVNSSVTTPPGKPRPPPAAMPLQKSFGAKPGQAPPPPGQARSSISKSCNGAAPGLNSLRLTTPLNQIMPRLQDKTPPTNCQQQGFITPMQATIIKTSQSSNAPIIKLRPPAQVTPPVFTAPSPSPAHRPPIITLSMTSPVPVHRPPTSTLPLLGHAQRSPILKPPSTSTPPTPAPASSAHRTPVPALAHRSPATSPLSVPIPALSSSPSLPQLRPQIITSPLSKSPAFRMPFSPALMATPHPSNVKDRKLTPSAVTSRQRAMGGANQGAKTSANRVSSIGMPDSALLNQVSSLPLGLGMFGGLVPVSLPFQFPLLNFGPPAGGRHPASSGYTLTQNLNQSPGGEVKRK